ncbi:MAG: aspartyl/glutamyl-tRNA amidotransferase subunit C [Candidatus Pacebacteria bacterium]|nr:aspartyl/glutamyl-tRNA amidotransferase subunit C [Candidatus Paceibacterota bacterium]MCD8528285.1 aspartyl/glutamyl-tRNA amidotransferase subunit C [Candidatus Paceibacterota bacterium]MCD8563974.1 aspartyl/glutamyl-tRNA amidotransferase subunit C [Candidatus Paceibacterota bacterium]
MSPQDIERLAELSRLRIDAASIPALQKDFQAIVGYVSSIQNIETGNTGHTRHDIANVMRSDDEAYESGRFTQDILDQSPDREGDYIRVKKVL